MVQPKRARRRRAAPPRGPHRDAELRIVGGKFRGRRLRYCGRPETRPMKERVREAIFNLLGPSIRGTHAIDLFAGTGALGLEALSRGAVSATLVEQHVPTARVIHENVARLSVEDATEVVTANSFVWSRSGPGRLPTERAWTIFCSPPYDFYVERREEILALIERLRGAATPGSILVVEADARFDFDALPRADAWTVRRYAPAVVGLLRDAQEM